MNEFENSHQIVLNLFMLLYQDILYSLDDEIKIESNIYSQNIVVFAVNIDSKNDIMIHD